MKLIYQKPFKIYEAINQNNYAELVMLDNYGVIGVFSVSIKEKRVFRFSTGSSYCYQCHEMYDKEIKNAINYYYFNEQEEEEKE